MDKKGDTFLPCHFPALHPSSNSGSISDHISIPLLPMVIQSCVMCLKNSMKHKMMNSRREKNIDSLAKESKVM